MFYRPMLLETSKTPFSSPDFIFERKYDGFRVIYSNMDTPILYTRNRGIITKQYPELILELPPGIILDGELSAFDSLGNDEIETVKKRFFMRKEEKILELSKSNPITYMVFDILHYQGRDIRGLPLLDRKKFLDELVKAYPSLQKVSYVDTKGAELFKHIQEKNLEGIVAKRKSSLYVGRRSSDWLKIINWIETEAVITGYRKQDNALVCNHHDLNPLGIVLHGMSPVQKDAFFKIAKNIKRGEDKDSIILEPILKCQLKGRGFTSKGIMRSPIFVDFVF